MPIRKVSDCSRPPNNSPIKLAPRALSLASVLANERIKAMPLNNIGRLVSKPTSNALVGYGKKLKRERSRKYSPTQLANNAP